MARHALHRALESAAQALLAAPTDAEAYAALSKAVFGAPDAFTSWQSPAQASSLPVLLRQTNCPAPLPIFAHTAASTLTSGNRAAVARVINHLAPQLAVALQPESETLPDFKPVLLLLLTVRAVAEPWLDQTRLSALHLDWFDRFTATERALPYSVMFSPDLFGQNRDEILADRWPGSNAPLHLPPDQLLFLSWLSGRDAFKGGQDAQDRQSALTDHYLAQDHGPSQRPAARALALRYGTPHPAQPEALQDIVETRQTISIETPASNPAPSQLLSKPYQARQIARQKLSAALPFLARSDRKRRVAICVSGQLRGYEQALKSWRKTLLGQVEATFFVQSWRRIGRADAQPFRAVLPFAGQQFSEAYREVALALGMDEMRQNYPSLFGALSDGSTTTAQHIKTLYETDYVVLDDETDAPFCDYTNQQKMHYKIYAADQMARAAGEFDLHLRIRPDLDIALRAFDWQDMYDACSDSALLMAEKPYGMHYGQLMMGDQFAIANPDTMVGYARTWLRQPALAKTEVAGCPAEFTGHVSLAICSWLAGIKTVKAPLKFGQLREAAPLNNLEIKTALQINSPDTEQTEKLMRAIDADLAG